MRHAVFAVLLAVAAAAPAAVFAADEPGQSGPCKADYEKLCKGVEPGEGRIANCLKENEGKLSPECKEKLGEAKKKRQKAKAGWEKACGDDVKALCADVKPGGGAILRCLKQNKDKVSDNCKSFVSDAKARRRQRRGKDEGKAAPADDKSDDKGADQK